MPRSCGAPLFNAPIDLILSGLVTAGEPFDVGGFLESVDPALADAIEHRLDRCLRGRRATLCAARRWRAIIALPPLYEVRLNQIIADDFQERIHEPVESVVKFEDAALDQKIPCTRTRQKC